MSTEILSLSIEEVTADYFDADALRAQPRVLYRVDGGDSRWYYDPDRGFYRVSVTSFIQATTPMSYGIIQWMISLGPNYKKIRDCMASYGTWFHVQATQIIISGEFDFDALELNLSVWADNEGYALSDTDWLAKAKQDIIGFILFVRRRNIKPLAVEVILDSKDGYAGALDLVCEMDTGDVYVSGPKKGLFKSDPERSVVMIDYKTRRTGWYESDELQLHMYKRAWDENYPDTQIDFLYNYGCADWKTNPAYRLKDQTDAKSAAKIPHLLKLWEIDGKTEPPASLFVSGKLDKDTTLESLYSFPTIADRIEAENDN